ncbi:MAG: putative phage abortive infection protein [Bacteroidetes bacterium]|nr:putative phage abortive infection protein [Bacteroidota bacterium]
MQTDKKPSKKFLNNLYKKFRKDQSIYIPSIIISILIIAAWFFTLFVLKERANRGTFGDMFGSINALFSGLAFGGIILTILLQRKELELQRKELRQTRKEFKIQNETLRLQRFENTFFSLLELHHQIVNNIYYYTSQNKPGLKMALSSSQESITIKGRDVFEARFDQLFKHLNKNRTSQIDITYMSYYPVVQMDFGHYFRNLYRIIKFVHNTEFVSIDYIPTENELEGFNSLKGWEEENYKIRYKYTSMVRAQLSDYELLWLFYNCLSINGSEKFKPLVEQYSLLKNLPENKLHLTDILSSYKPEAYGRS